MARFDRCMSTTITSSGPVGPEDLRALRAKAGLTQRELSRLAGCSLSWIANAEGGYVPRSSETLDRVLEVLSKEDDPGRQAEAVQDAEAAAHDQA